MRALALALLGALLVAGTAAAQDPPVDPDESVEQVVGGEEDEDGEDGEEEEPDPCAGADADYTYGCRPCPPEGDEAYQPDSDYVYSCPQTTGGGPPPAPKPRPTVAAARPLPAGQLPATGQDAWLVLAAGLGLVTAGTGLRLRLG